MFHFLRSAWAEVFAPFFRRPVALQMAALCWRQGESGREVLLVKSSSGRWILPKGWPIDGKNGPETALQEAWEEAGVRKGKADPVFAGFRTNKRFDNGHEIRCEVQVYPVKVAKLENDYPEAERRERQWVSIIKACDMVDEPGLKSILQNYGSAA